MTLPDERTRALIYARGLLLQLSRLPPELDACGLRELAVHVLRHYPDEGMIRLIAGESIWLEWPQRIERDIK
ncbi:BPSL0761 family protein [Paraburkholderia caballeronis]|uniref:BPSL0761 family protein n=1 Tax=Paraburkholderia caballeronis TaxID=416943 RepID=UPI003C7BF079